jgi:pyrroline-5-carboxylate reductase
MRVLVVGAGKMVEAIIAGLPGPLVSTWAVTSKSGSSAKDLSAKYGLKYVENISDFPHPDWILLGCKPQQIKDISIPDVPVMSLLAALPEKSQKETLKVSHLVRVMPNLPVRFNKGVTLLYSSSKSHMPFPTELFRKLGVVKHMEEKEFEEITLLTGSGPALFYEFTKTLAASFTSLSEADREELAKAVLMGAAHSVEGQDLQKLIDAVTSKGGVTIAVLEEWRKNGLGSVLGQGVKNGLKRTEELKSHLLQN